MPKLPCLYEKLKGVYEQHDNIILAVDFDDTIYDWKDTGWDCNYVVDLVKRCQQHLNAKVMLFTCRSGDKLDFALRYCAEVELTLWGINYHPDHRPTDSKPFYNVLLDDKACLSEVCNVLEYLLEDLTDYDKD